MKYNQQPGPSQPRSDRLLWVVLALLLIATLLVVGCLYLGAKAEKPAAKGAAKAPPACAANYRTPFYYAGQPRPATYPNPLHILTNMAYVVGYDETRMCPGWVCYRVFKVDSLVGPGRQDSLRTDMRTMARVTPSAYAGSGYDRGHMAPCYAIGVCYGSEPQAQTFLMSNMMPQRPKLNRDVWENLERTEMREYAQAYGEVWVIDGGYFDLNVERLKSGVEVPDATWKILVKEEGCIVKVLAFLIPQTVTGSENVASFLTTVDDIEAKTGLDFLSELPDDLEAEVERSRMEMW